MEESNQQQPVYKSKNLMAERTRRTKINQRLYALRALVPNITKMSKATILDDAFDYIEDLKKQVKELEDELVEMGDEREEKQESEASKWEMAQEVQKCELDVVVTPVDAKTLEIKIVCEKKEGGFSKLMAALGHLGLEVTSINVTSFRGVALNTICVEGELEMLKPIQVKELLIEMVKEHLTI
ncbi:hypothetical protein MRB53_022451 [Persea americana]|uniref:Uncharacterized protein n=1 Tax=Persea americana TaxID=3435 RepID=A0ACC2L7V4_PERAE|nr:hypothetical protein MRB53_022451 [Persea americana]